MSITALVARLTAALASFPTDSLNQAIADLREAEERIARLAQGSSASELPQSAQLCQDARQSVEHVTRLLDQVLSIFQRYLAQIGATGTPSPAQPNGPTTSRPPAPVGLTAGQADVLRQRLPPPVPKPNPGRKKTHGRWIDGHGREHELVSGEDDDSVEAWRLLQQAGMPPMMEPVNVAHVEMKLAVQMRHNKTQHIDVVINNRPCHGPYGCEKLLPIVLPAGYTITVHGPNYRKTFTGGARWSR
ncbi:DddA-like double-stranded DNA deaminase toxin [Actinokineospora sp.]|uniref:DddA-like double-stranded DNA deaminase toxin n=1 Tax=Actinokineospora sp. TaxID=1872133 RepID=UPI004037A401